MKRRLKADQKAKEKIEKEKAAKENAATTKKPTTKSAELSQVDEEISPNEFFKLRSAAVQEWRKNPETHPYPHKFHVSISLEAFIEKYNHIADGERLESERVSVAGRIHSIRISGAKLIFYDLRGESVKIQVMANANSYHNEEAFAADVNRIRRGDIIGVEGVPGKTKKGELSIIPSKVTIQFIDIFRRSLLNKVVIFSDSIVVAMFAHASNTAFRSQGQRNAIPSTLFRLDFE